MTKRNFLLSLLLTVWGAATTWALVPENGKTYYIYCDNDTPQYFYVNGNNSLAIANKPVSMSKRRNLLPVQEPKWQVPGPQGCVQHGLQLPGEQGEKWHYVLQR